jgi:hypothetical protein
MMTPLLSNYFTIFKVIYNPSVGKRNPMPRDNREVESTLLNKFVFTPARTRGNDHRWFELTLPGLPTIATKFSHTREDIGDPLWRKIAMQLRVRPQYLTGMISCSNSREAYYTQVRTDPFPPWSHLIRGSASKAEEPSKQQAAQKKRKKRKR